MEELYVSYKDQIEFLIVYIREAHPEMLEEDHHTGVVGRPKDFDQRVILATQCATEFEFTIPMVIDGMDGKVNADYKAAPVRVAITDVDGKVVYYAGKGPRDFRLPAVERVLKRLVTNQGHVPPPPEPQWGASVNGLRCGASLDPPNPRIGEDVVARFEFNNVTEEPLGLYLPTAQILKSLVLTHDADTCLTIETEGSKRNASSPPREGRRRRRRQVYEIKPGDSVFYDVYGTVSAASKSPKPGPYQYQMSMTVDANTAASLEEERENGYDFALWTGQIRSAPTMVQAGPPLPASCIDCHGKPDYHHLKSTGCQDCHIGEVGEEDFTTRKDACGQCHPRPGKQGRRQILGKNGEFRQASRHVYGRIEDSDCLTCHDAGAHRNGKVSLVDPTEGDGWPWKGTQQDFCLTCHAKQPPKLVSFPAEAKGSGYDKSRFAQTTHAKWLGDSSCGHCHYSHGSSDHALLRGSFALNKKQATGSADEDYGLCWTCHDPNRILTEVNAFDRGHNMHVKTMRIACATCHDVHGATDPDEAGLIKLQANARSGFHFTGNRSESTGFEIDVTGNRGTCYVSCHQDNAPKSYARDQKKHSVTCMNCH